MPRSLSNIRFKRVALVDKGANLDKETNDGAHILLWKRHVEDKRMNLADLIKKALGIAVEPDAEKRKTDAEALTKALETPGSPEHEAAEDNIIGQLSAMHPDHIKAMKQQHAALGTMIDSYGPGPHSADHPVHAMKAAHVKMGGTLAMCKTDQLAKKETEVDEKAVQVEIEKAVQIEVEKAKAITADLEKRLVASEAQNKETAELLKAERATRQKDTMITLLKSFKATPLVVDLADPKNDVDRFLKMQAADADGFARTIELLKAADAQNSENLLFKRQIGSNQGGVAEGSAEAQLVAKADAIIQKSATKLSKEQAFEQACFENPKLVAEYRTSQQ